MRWDDLRAGPEGEGQAADALFGRGTVARSFDTPGFRGMTFFEVQARSIINRVPGTSRVPFRWTINPYRGCSHACTYCAAGETPVLMADGRTRPLADLRPGDGIYGTARRGGQRRYVRTTVVAHWQTVRPAFRVTLADGTRLITSGDHRFLSGRGWRHVSGAPPGAPPRPALAATDTLLGVGRLPEPPKHDADYRRGYLCGLAGAAARPGAGGGPEAGGPEAAGRARRFLAGAHPAFAARLAGWPAAPGRAWHQGFLAGLFDAGGQCGPDALLLPGPGPGLPAGPGPSLQALGFRFTAGPGPGSCRLAGDLAGQLRFFLTTDPATAAPPVAGRPAGSHPGLRVSAIEPLGLDLPLYDITTGTGDFIAGGVVSHNCFARNSHTYLDLDAGHDFDSKIVVKVNAPHLVRRELAARRWRGEHIAMGTNVDVYQRAEGRYRLMPGILQALLERRNPYSILTKGTLILRDLDLLLASADVTDVGLSVSVGCAGEELWRALEPGTPSPQRRLGVCATLSDHGLRCGVLMGPVVPFLTDSPAQLAATVRQASEAGAAHVSPIVLHLRPGAREWFLGWLAREHPELVPRYRGLYGNRAYAPRDYQERIAAQVRELAARYRVGRRAPAPATPRAAPGGGWRGSRAPAAAGDAGEQLTLL